VGIHVIIKYGSFIVTPCSSVICGRNYSEFTKLPGDVWQVEQDMRGILHHQLKRIKQQIIRIKLPFKDRR
jgi:hypothetical protein